MVIIMKKKIVAGALAIVVTAALVVGVVVVGPGKKNEQVVPEATDQVVVEIETEEEKETEPAPTVIVKDKQDKVDIEIEQVASSADPDTGLHGNGDGGVTEIPKDDFSYNAYKEQVLDETAERAIMVMYAAADTSVYSEMSLESEVLGTLKLNDEIETYGNVDGWFVIKYGDRDGYIPEAYVAAMKQIIESQVVVPEPEPDSTPVIVPESQVSVPETPAQPESTPSQEIVDSGTNAGVTTGGSGTDTDADIEAALRAVFGEDYKTTDNPTVYDPSIGSNNVDDSEISEEDRQRLADWVWH